MELQKAQEGRLLWPRSFVSCVCMLSHFSRAPFFATPWTVAQQAPMSMRFSRKEYWSGLPSLPPGDLPDPGIKPPPPTAPALQAESLSLSHRVSPFVFCNIKQSALPLLGLQEMFI